MILFDFNYIINIPNLGEFTYKFQISHIIQNILLSYHINHIIHINHIHIIHSFYKYIF